MRHMYRTDSSFGNRDQPQVLKGPLGHTCAKHSSNGVRATGMNLTLVKKTNKQLPPKKQNNNNNKPQALVQD